MTSTRSLVRSVGKALGIRRRRSATGNIHNSLTRGNAARARKDWDAAAAAYRQHLDDHPNDGAIWIQLGHALKEGGRLKPATAAYLRAYRLDSDDADLLLQIGHVAKLRGLSRAAALAYRASYHLDQGEDAVRELSSASLGSALPYVERRFPQVRRARSLNHRSLLRHQIGSIESVNGWMVRGWVVDRDRPDVPATISFFVNGTWLCDTTADSFRFDIDSLGYGSPLAGFTVELPLDLGGSEPQLITARLSRTGEELSGSPFAVSAPPLLAEWLRRKRRLKGEELALVVERNNALVSGTLSIVIPVYNTQPDWLAEALESVLSQWCDHWELICVDDCSPNSRVRTQLMKFAERDARIRLVLLDTNVGIAAATNAGIAAATGDFVAFMDHDDYLEPDAVFRVLTAASSEVDFIYTDEAITGEDINVIRSVAARPAFSYDYYLSHPYFVHLNVARLSVARAIGGWDESMRISADVDFVYRMIEASRFIAHVPAVLYRWRTHGDSTGHTSIDQVTPATLGALSRHLRRIGQEGEPSQGYQFNTYRIDFADDRGRTLIIIPTKNGHDLVQACLRSIWETIGEHDDVHVVVIDHESTDPESVAYFRSLADDPRVTMMPYKGRFNYARMNNEAASAIGDNFKYVLFMNNDVEAIDKGWLAHMRGLARRDDVGIVGASLIYGNHTYQHSGVVMGLGDLVDHAHKFVSFKCDGRRNLGYNCTLVSTRDYLAVTGACMMMRRDLFLGVGGFDEALEIGYNDTDLCMRIGSLGYKILNDAFAVLYHHESVTRTKVGSMDHPKDYATFKKRWGHILETGDPFYNHALAPRSGEDHRLYEVSSVYAPARIREVRPSIATSAQATPHAIDTLRIDKGTRAPRPGQDPVDN